MSTQRFDERPGNKVLQDMCNEVFGKDAVSITRWWAWNDITFLLSCPEDFAGFIENFKERLKRLGSRFAGTDSYPTVLKTVAQLAERNRCENAYAKLAAWDIMWNNYLMLGIEVDEQGRGRLPDNGMYFNVGLLGNVLEGAKMRRTMKNVMYMQVLVNAPVFAYSEEAFGKMNDDYYEWLAQRTFCERGSAMKNLAGFIVIDDGIDNDYYHCHVYLNPKAAHRDGLAELYLGTLNCGRDDLGILGSFLDYIRPQTCL